MKLPRIKIVKNGGVHFVMEVSLGNILSLSGALLAIGSALVTGALAYQDLVAGQASVRNAFEMHVREYDNLKVSAVPHNVYSMDRAATQSRLDKIDRSVEETQRDVKEILRALRTRER